MKSAAILAALSLAPCRLAATLAAPALGRSGLAALLLLASAAAAADAPRPEAIVLQRNFHANGQNPYEFSADRVLARTVEPSAKGVKVTFADGHSLEVPADGAVQLDILRNGKAAVPGDNDRFRDAFAAAFLVQASPEEVNHAIRDVTGYPAWFGDKEKYQNSFYKAGAFLDLAKHPQHAATLKASEQAVTDQLKAASYQVDKPESNLIELSLTVGEGNTFATSDAKPTLLTTCYRIRKDASAGSPLVVILNDNSLAKPDKVGGSEKQNIVWVIEEIPGKGTLVRHVYANEYISGKAAWGKDKRWEMAQLNVIEFCNGIRDRALDVKKRGLVKK